MEEASYTATTEKIERICFQFLRAFEDAQQNIDFHNVANAQQQLLANGGDALVDAVEELRALAPPASHAKQYAVLRMSLDQLQKAFEGFSTSAMWPDFATAFMASRREQCRALEFLYANRDLLPIIEPYFRISGVPPKRVTTAPDAPTGVLHNERSTTHHDYSLYVPEYYDPAKKWPLVVCLHGGYGRGDDYIWTWLRLARSYGYVLLSPKSLGPTWSIMQPAVDIASITEILDIVDQTYSIDHAKVLLTGLSDGATFSYLFGLEHAERFAALAPIAGVLSPMTDTMLRAKEGSDLPIHVVHGAKDTIFPVHTARSTSKLLEKLGYRLTYTELPTWGHALTYAINEDIVLPWFESVVVS